MASSHSGSLDGVDSFDNFSHLSSGDGLVQLRDRDVSAQLEDGYFMDVEELVKCLNELDNDLPPGPEWRPVEDTPHLIRPPHCRREAVVCVVSLRTASTFCFAVVSRLGRVGVYDANFSLLDSYTLELGFIHPHAKVGIGREGDLREPRQHNTWVNDAIFLDDAQMLVVAASDRSLTMLDASRLLHSRRCEIRSLPAAPRCLAYAAGGAGGAGGEASRLFIGDVAGGVTTLTFLCPRRALLRPPDAENKSTSFFWPELRQQGEWVAVQEDLEVHGDAVSRLLYEPHNDTLLSCSRDPQRTLAIRHLAGRRPPYVFSLPRGASCFALSRPVGTLTSLQLLVTAGRDAVVRLWNPLVPSQPQATLLGHKAPVLDVAVDARGQLVVSADLRGTLKVWHAEQHTCLQTMVLPFTCLDVPGRRIEHGARLLYPGPPTAPSGSPDSDGAMVLVVALCGELVIVRVLPMQAPTQPPGQQDDDVKLAPPRREQSPAIPESWSPSLLSPSSSSSRGARKQLLVEGWSGGGDPHVKDALEGTSADRDVDVDEDEQEDEPVPVLGSQCPSPLPESIEDWPEPDDRLFKDDEPQMQKLAAVRSTSATAPPQPVSHRPVPDENGLYPEEVASLRALGLRPLDLESIGVSLGSASSAPTRAGGGALSLLPMNALAAVRQAHAAQKKSHKQMRTLAWHCAPHLALKLPEETPITFSRPLPVTSRMRAKGIEVSNPECLMQAKLSRLGAVSRHRTAQQTSGSVASSMRLSSTGDTVTGSL